MKGCHLSYIHIYVGLNYFFNNQESVYLKIIILFID